MKAASIKELKTELTTLFPDQLMELCLKLAKSKKENKELLTYLLFESNDEPAYINKIKSLMDEEFKGLNKHNSYLANKTVRKILRDTNKFINYSGSKQTEVELRMYFCKKIRSANLSLRSNTTLANLYQRQLLKIRKVLATLHEDLQYDYSDELKML